MLQSAILDRLAGSLCDAIIGQSDGQEILEMLERANLFIVPLDNKRNGYRYHHLVTELLRQRLRQTNPERIPELHQLAGKWYAQIDLWPMQFIMHLQLKISIWLQIWPSWHGAQ